MHRLDAPAITVVVATNRPEFLGHALQQVRRQAYPQRQLVVGLHGDRFAASTPSELRAMTDLPVEVVEVDAAESLGAVLNACLPLAEGTLITKMDDDDYYGDEHLWDLALAHGYSGAEVVGKGAEFVYLRSQDLTVRRFATGGERRNITIAGGTLCTTRAWLRQLGGFVDASLGEDRSLIDETVAAGGSVYRTHGYGYVLHRHENHAWRMHQDYFANDAVASYTGLADQQALV